MPRRRETGASCHVLPLLILLLCVAALSLVSPVRASAGELTFGGMKAIDIEIGERTAAAIAEDGSLWMWGQNDEGQLGDGTTSPKYSPVRVMDDVVEVSLGYWNSAAITSDGSLWTWGQNYLTGAIGDGTETDRLSPVRVMDDVASVAMGGGFCLALKTDGSLWTWGLNVEGALGDGSNVNRRTTPAQIMDGVKSISCSHSSAALLKTDGSLWTWGDNDRGQLGNGTTYAQSRPWKIMDDVASFEVGNLNMYAITKDGSLWTWGWNAWHQVGNESHGTGLAPAPGDGNPDDVLSPYKVMEDVSQAAVGDMNTAAIKNDGSLWMWGYNSHGEIKPGTSMTQEEPCKVADDVRAVSIGGDVWPTFSLLDGEGNLWLWGSNEIGLLGDGTTVSNYNPPTLDGDDGSTTLIPGKVTHWYGATQENTPEASIQKLAKGFVWAMDDYFSSVQEAASDDTRRAGSSGVSKVEILKEIDQASETPILTLSGNLYFGRDDGKTAEEALDAAYTVLADYFDEYVERGEQDNRIDMSASTIEISANIVNKIRDSFQFDSFTRHVGSYTVEFTITVEGWGPFKGYLGRVDVRSSRSHYTGVVVSSPQETAAALESYVNVLADWSKDALYEAVSSLATDLTQVTGIADFTEREMRDMIEDRVASLQRRGFGDLLTYWLTVRDGYDIVKPLATALDANDMKDALKSARRIYEKLDELDYTDAGVTNRTVKNAMSDLRSARDKLSSALFDYISDGSVETSWWDELITSIWVQCPVDVTVYDAEGAVLGSVIDGEVTRTDSIGIEVVGDAKHIIVPSSIRSQLLLEGTDYGQLTLVAEQLVDNVPSGRMISSFELKDGGVYTYTPPTGSMDEKNTGYFVSADGLPSYTQQYLSADDSNASVAVAATAAGSGTVTGSGSYPKGDPVILEAYPADDGTVFDGWYLDDELVCASNVYQFPASGDISVEARFSPARIVDEEVRIAVSDAYANVLGAFAYRAAGGLDDLVLSIAGAEGIDEPTRLVVKSLDDGGGLIKETTVNTVRDGSFRFEARSLDLRTPERVEVYAADGSLILTVGEGDSGEQVVSERTMYRLYNPNTGEHFYTATVEERDSLDAIGWVYEGVGWVAPTTGDPIYRLYNPNAPGGDHHYTGSEEERDNLVSVGWRYEGVGWYSDGPVKIYRQYNPNAASGTHNYTASLEENDMLVSLGWRYEGIGWDALRAQ